MLEETAEPDTLESKYKVLWDRPLGQGSFGDVYLAKSRETGEEFALKKIDKNFTDDGTFQREMDALLIVKENGGHPNICGTREHFEEGDFYYIVLDLIKGREMFEQLCAYGPYSEADASILMRQVASALAYLHGVGVVHSDLKPENLMLSSKHTDEAGIKVVDFGCAHLIDKVHDHEHRGTAATPAYCAPEVLKSIKERPNEHAKIEPAFDMWSIGVIAYVMLVGRHPFDIESENTDAQIETLILSGTRPPLRKSEYTKHLSEEAIDLLDKMLEWDPVKRFTADELLKHPWIQGKNASSKKMAHSDRRLAVYRKHEAKVMRNFFLNMLSYGERKASEGDTISKRTCLLETAFRNLDPKNRGYISTKELNGSTSVFEADAKLSLAEVADLLSERMKNQYFPKDHVIYNEGDKGDKMYFLNSGAIEVTNKDGTYYQKRQSGEFCGEDALLSDDHNRIHSVKCLTPVHAIAIDRADFNKYLAGDEDVQLHMADNDKLRNREKTKTILGLQKDMKKKTYKKGEIPFRAGDAGNTLYILEEGQVDLLVNGNKVRSLRPGEMTGEHAAFFNAKPYNVTCMCVSDRCQMQTIKDIRKVFKKNSPALEKDFRHIILFRDFKKALVATTGRSFPETEEELRAAFDTIDTDKSGSVGFDKLRHMVREFDSNYTEDDIHDMLGTLDLSKTGKLTWEAFRKQFANDRDM